MLKYNGQYPTGPKAARVFLKQSPLFRDATGSSACDERTAAMLLSENWGQNPGPPALPSGD